MTRAVNRLRERQDFVASVESPRPCSSRHFPVLFHSVLECCQDDTGCSSRIVRRRRDRTRPPRLPPVLNPADFSSICAGDPRSPTVSVDARTLPSLRPRFLRRMPVGMGCSCWLAIRSTLRCPGFDGRDHRHLWRVHSKTPLLPSFAMIRKGTGKPGGGRKDHTRSPSFSCSSPVTQSSRSFWDAEVY